MLRAVLARLGAFPWSRLGFTAMLLVGATAARAVPVPPPASAAVGLIGVRLGGDSTSTRVVLDLDAAAAGKLLAEEGSPGHLVIGLPPLLSTDRLQGRGLGVVSAWHVTVGPRASRLVLDVAPGAGVVHRFLIPPPAEGGNWRYVIDVKPAAAGDAVAALTAPSKPVPAKAAPPVRVASVAVASPPPPARAPMIGAESGVMKISNRAMAVTPPAPPEDDVDTAAGLAPTLPPPTPAPPSAVSTRTPSPGAAQRLASASADKPVAAIAKPAPSPIARPAPARAPAPAGRGLKVIVVDAGHGGHDPGARSLVRNEKDLTLAAALNLKARLEKMGRYKVVLTRDSDVFIPLESRVQIARKAGADLFISLHADSAGSDPTPHGASIYTLSDSGQTRVNYVLGPHEWFANTGGKRTDVGVRQILLDLTQRSTRNRSSQFASVLIEHISDKVDLLPRSHRDAGYFVLLAPDVPAVLLEMGFITNPGDEMRLTDPAQRDRLMGGVAAAIDAYFSGATRLAAG